LYITERGSGNKINRKKKLRKLNEKKDSVVLSEKYSN
jgi:hypothetical protein